MLYHRKLLVVCVVSCFQKALSLQPSAMYLAADYFTHKLISHVCVLSCDGLFYNQIVKHLMSSNIMVSLISIKEDTDIDGTLHERNTPVGVVIDAACKSSDDVMIKASRLNQFDASHVWLVVAGADTDSSSMNSSILDRLNLSVDADVILANRYGDGYELTDIFNFGKIQGNNLERSFIGTWRRQNGLNIPLKRFKYYDRWDFHNLTLRAVSVIPDEPRVFSSKSMSEVMYTRDVTAITKVAGQLLEVLKENHNFRFNFTIAGRWVGSPERDSALAVTNSLYWREQDISYTCVRIYPQWLDWMDPFHPPAMLLQTKFYYLIPESGVGDFENQFLRPMSGEVWYCACAAGGLCAAVLAVAAYAEMRPQPYIYALFSVLASACQQGYEDGVHLVDKTVSGQARRLTLFVLGLTSMVLYNYYTSSVVSWLLNAEAPTIANLDGLVKSDLQVVFEDTEYTRQWLDNPGVIYYSGFLNTKEDDLRDIKVTRTQRKTQLLQSVEDGIKLVQAGGYAYHSEEYTANHVISRRFNNQELCKLGSLKMMPPTHVYIVGQKRSPYKQFFDWSLLRMLERGHVSATQHRVIRKLPSCSGPLPRALTLGQAAPALAILCQAALLACVILIGEIIWFRMKQNQQ